MKRRVTQFLFALGVLLSIVATLAIVRGFWATDIVEVEVSRNVTPEATRSHLLGLRLGQRACALAWDRKDVVFPPGTPTSTDPFDLRVNSGPPLFITPMPLSARTVWERLGFVWIAEDRRPWPPLSLSKGGPSFAHRVRGVIVPTWFVALVAALLTFFPLRALHRTRRVRLRAEAGLCLACGYDLRGAEHARCPECGAVVAPAVGAPARV